MDPRALRRHNPRSLQLRFHTQTAGVSLTAQQPEINIVRTAVEALAGVLGGTQSLHTNSMDEAMALPTEKAARIALRTQQIIANETNVAHVADPLGGSWYVEQLTDAMEAWPRRCSPTSTSSARDRCSRAASRGIEDNWFQGRIADSAYELERAINSGRRTVVGVSAYTEGNDSDALELLQITHEDEARQLKRLEQVRHDRDKRRGRGHPRCAAGGRRRSGGEPDAGVDRVGVGVRHARRGDGCPGRRLRAPRRGADDLAFPGRAAGVPRPRHELPAQHAPAPSASAPGTYPLGRRDARWRSLYVHEPARSPNAARWRGSLPRAAVARRADRRRSRRGVRRGDRRSPCVAVQRRGPATLAVSGGSTRTAHARRAGGDRPAVGPSSASGRSTSGSPPTATPTATPTQLDALPGTHHLMPVTAADLDAAAAGYAAGLPDRFDVVHLGMGPDGHTASWPPGDPVIERDEPVTSSQPYQGRVRMTLTPSGRQRAPAPASCSLTGADKAAARARLARGRRRRLSDRPRWSLQHDRRRSTPRRRGTARRGGRTVKLDVGCSIGFAAPFRATPGRADAVGHAAATASA